MQQNIDQPVLVVDEPKSYTIFSNRQTKFALYPTETLLYFPINVM